MFDVERLIEDGEKRLVGLQRQARELANGYQQILGAITSTQEWLNSLRSDEYREKIEQDIGEQNGSNSNNRI